MRQSKEVRRLTRIDQGGPGAERLRMKKVAVAALIAGLAFIGTSTALANSLVSTSPVAGQALQSAPSAVTIATEMPLLDSGNEVTVTDPSGARVDDGTLTVSDVNVLVGLKPLVKPGVYTVTYSLLAENDLPLTGTFTFNFTEPSVSATVAPQPTKAPRPSGNNLGTSIFVLGLLASAGIVALLLVRYARKLYSER